MDDMKRTGAPRTVLTKVNLGRLKKMKNRSLRSVDAYTSNRGENGPTRIPRETARRGREEIGHQFFRYVIFSVYVKMYPQMLLEMKPLL